jgi:T-complex protein 1 subunit gamma
LITQLRAKHASDPLGNKNWGVDGDTGVLVDMSVKNLWEPLAVRAQTIKTAVEAASMLLRVDDILSGGKPKSQGGDAPQQPSPDDVPPEE